MYIHSGSSSVLEITSNDCRPSPERRSEIHTVFPAASAKSKDLDILSSDWHEVGITAVPSQKQRSMLQLVSFIPPDIWYPPSEVEMTKICSDLKVFVQSPIGLKGRLARHLRDD
jgi:hypothetical protein